MRRRTTRRRKTMRRKTMRRKRMRMRRRRRRWRSAPTTGEVSCCHDERACPVEFQMKAP